MAHWWETDQRTAEQNRQAQRAYYRTLLSSAAGRRVLYDMRRRSAASKDLLARSSEFAMAQLWLDDFMDETFKLCGVTDLMALIEAAEKIASRHEPQQEQADLPEGFEE